VRLEFQSQAIQLISGRAPANKWDWYFLMQHHGVPTRLLDWTENSLIALFFAVEDEAPDCDSAVWVLDPWWLAKKLRLGTRGPLLPDYDVAGHWLFDLEDAFYGRGISRNLPAPIEPPHVDRRVAAQSSRFLVFGTTRDLTRSLIVRKNDCRLARVAIPASARDAIKKELDDCGINFSLLFPDLEGLARHILWRWKRHRT
jgi:FRG domain